MTKTARTTIIFGSAILGVAISFYFGFRIGAWMGYLEGVTFGRAEAANRALGEVVDEQRNAQHSDLIRMLTYHVTVQYGEAEANSFLNYADFNAFDREVLKGAINFIEKYPPALSGETLAAHQKLMRNAKRIANE